MLQISKAQRKRTNPHDLLGTLLCMGRSVGSWNQQMVSTLDWSLKPRLSYHITQVCFSEKFCSQVSSFPFLPSHPTTPKNPPNLMLIPVPTQINPHSSVPCSDVLLIPVPNQVLLIVCLIPLDPHHGMTFQSNCLIPKQCIQKCVPATPS